MESLISVIVPVYNCEKYLSKCVRSILFQTYQNLEILLIDDGSTDNSGNICELFSKKDSRVKVIHQSNGGISNARNKGLDCAKGEFFCFVDGDDWLPCDAFEKLYASITSHHSDMSYGNLIFVEPLRDYTLPCIPEKELCYSLDDYASLDRYLTDDWLVSVRRLYRSDIQKKYFLRFDETVRTIEDELFVLNYLSHCAQVSVIPDSVYYYNRLNMQTASRQQHQFKDNSEWIFLSARQWTQLFSGTECKEATHALQKRCLHKWYYACRTNVINLPKEKAVAKLQEVNNHFLTLVSPKDIAENEKIPFADLYVPFLQNNDCEELYNTILERESKKRNSFLKNFMIKMSRCWRLWKLYGFHR